jgi:hypothetical protein
MVSAGTPQRNVVSSTRGIAAQTGVLPFVTMDDLLARARAELYAAEPDDFMRLRAELADAAKADGQAAVAKQIAAQRKPTKAAWTLNQLSRRQPDAAQRLAELAAALQRGGDGARLRELTQARSRLIDELTRQAFAAAGDPAPPAALREDVIATLGAALADPEVAADLAEGTLVRAAHWAGFGLVPLTPGPARKSAAKPEPEPAVEDDLARRRRQKLISAEQAVADATQAASSAASSEADLEDTVRDLEARLEQARQELAVARRESYRAESRRKRAVTELDRFRE